jgi:pyruvate/2-oxoglutarate dehydrogenase complex dihydrolipoamide dehydrogenase (E3) component
MPDRAFSLSVPPAISSANEEVDLLLLGSGEAGKFLAWTFARKGWKVAVIERRWIGGSCPNIACLPSKNIIHSAKVASFFRRGPEFGLPDDTVTVDMSAVRERKRTMVRELVQMHEDNYASSGAELIRGEGRFIAPKTIEVTLADGTHRTLRGSKVVIGTGTTAMLDSTPGLASARPLTHIEALELNAVPSELLILGGGFIGLEFAQAMQRLGSLVTIVDRNDRLLHNEDPDVSNELSKILTDEGVQVVLSARVCEVFGKSGERVRLVCQKSSVEGAIEGTHLLAATGRSPNTRGIGLEEYAGIELDEKGYIAVDDQLRTSAADVFAVGECNGGQQFTHVAFDDFRVVRDTLNGIQRTTRGRVIPFCLFTDPEFARIGLTENEAARQELSYKLFKIPMTRNLRARTLSETKGFMKALVSAEDGRILGFACLGAGAGEMMAPVQIAMKAGWPYTALDDVMFAHPTFSEGLINLFSSEARLVRGRAAAAPDMANIS